MWRRRRIDLRRSKPEAAAAAQDATSALIDCGLAEPDQSADSITETPANPDSMNSEINSTGIPFEALVRHVYTRAFEALHQGNHAEVLRLMNDLASKYENTPHSAYIHRLYGGFCYKVSCITGDPDAKLSHMKNALSHAKKAAGLSPRTIEYAIFYAKLLRDLGNDEEAVEECERALSIENPEGPEAFVEDIRRFLRLRIQRSNISIISRWMNGEESQGRRALVDPIELRLHEVLDKKPESLWEGIAAARIRRQAQNSANEMKNVTEEKKRDIEEQSMPEASQPTNMAEEQRKEIKEQVMPEASQPRNMAEEQKEETEASQQGNMATVSEGQRKEIEERLTAEASQQRNPVKSQSKSGKGTKAAFPEVQGWVKSYWDSLSSAGKKDLLTIKVSDLKKYLSSSKDRALIEVLEEAIFFEEGFNESWKFWSCSRCDKKLGTSELLIDHVWDEHWVNAWPNTERRALRVHVDDEWLDYLRYSSWEPLDLNAATKMLEEMPKSDGSSPRKRKPGDDNSLYDWPLSNDPERKEHLLKIYSFFEKLDQHRCLASDLVRKVTKFAVDELKGLACGSAAEQEVNQTPVCIRFLGAPELKRITRFLEEVSWALKLKICTGEKDLDDSDSAVQGIEIIEKIRLGEDGSLLVIDEHSLPCKIDDISTAPNASHVVFENGVILDSDALLSWIFTGASSSLSAQLASWKLAMVPTMKIQRWFQMLMLESDNLLTFCDRKYAQLSDEEAVMAVEDLCLEEGKKKDRQDYEKFLKERCEEQNISTAQNYVMTNVLSMANSIKSGEISFEEAYYGGITSHPKDCWRKKAHLHEADSYIEAAIRKQKDAITTELSQTDVVMMRIAALMKRLQDKIADESCHDFRAILLPFIKSFLKAQVEEVAMIEAKKKADAVAKELLLAELPLESKKGKKNDLKKKKATGK